MISTLRKKADSETSERILTTALRLLGERGYANVSLRDIADGAGVALSQIGYYFHNKVGLFTSVIRRVSDCLWNEFHPYLCTANDFSQWIGAISDSAIRFISTHNAYVRVLIDFSIQAQWKQEILDELRCLFDRFDTQIRQTLQAIDEFDEAKMRGVSCCVLGMLLGTSALSILGIPEAKNGLRIGQCALSGIQIKGE